MAHKIGVGLIGINTDPAKSWATRAHVPALRHLSESYALNAVCTSKRETAEAAASHFGIPHAFSDPRKLAEHPDVDLVVVTVKTPLHAQLVEAALAARKHVYCEWPLGATTDEARRMADATEQAGVAGIIGLQASGNEVVRHVRDLVAAGHVGRVLSASLLVGQRNFGGREAASHAYSADDRNGTTLLTVAGGHALEGLCYCLGEFRELDAILAVQHRTATVIETGAQVEKTSPDQIMVSGILRSGAVASVHVKGGMTRTTGVRLEINGTEGDLIAESQGDANIQRAALALRGGRGGDPFAPMPLPDSYRLQPPGLPEGSALSVAHLYAGLVEPLRTGAPVAHDFRHAVRRHELLDAIRRSSASGQRQLVPT